MTGFNNAHQRAVAQHKKTHDAAHRSAINQHNAAHRQATNQHIARSQQFRQQATALNQDFARRSAAVSRDAARRNAFARQQTEAIIRRSSRMSAISMNQNGRQPWSARPRVAPAVRARAATTPATPSPMVVRSHRTPAHRTFGVLRGLAWLVVGLAILVAATSKQGQALAVDLIDWGQALYAEQIQPFLESE